MTFPNAETTCFLDRVARTIDEACLIRPGQHVLVACSGGADSVALLTALTRLAEDPRRRYVLTVAHLNHGLREAAEDDAAFVADLAREHELEIVQASRDVSSLAEQLGEGIEHAAREARYDFLAATARDCGAEAVAMAHHADDNVETALFRMLRGSALRGLAGMPLRRGLRASDGGAAVEIIRPLLHCRQDTILEFLRAGSIHWREDETNEDPAYKRNFIRHELLPTIRWHVNQRVDEAVLRLSEIARQAETYIAGQADTLLRKATVDIAADALTLSAMKLAAAAPIVRTTALRLALERLEIPQRDLATEHLHQLDALLTSGDGATVNLPGDLQARRQGTQLVIAQL
ncbi:MAG: tRNA lysidine(34) synthetase TilS [Planctomycetes bacterium]|nr:tRNA lysidine(34) synthetase TilS [Planctomycetota bacterium]